MPDYRISRSKFTENLPEIVEPLADAWVDAANAARRRHILDAATRGQRLLLGYYWYWDDVTNGGHWQYFRNYTGNLWQEALEATRVLRLPEERILRAAVALFPGKQPSLAQRKRRQQLGAIDRAKFDRLDDRFHGLTGADTKIRRYIDSHPDEFFMPKRSK
jgi:DNA-binding GntR family transcriptional regulator